MSSSWKGTESFVYNNSQSLQSLPCEQLMKTLAPVNTYIYDHSPYSKAAVLLISCSIHSGLYWWHVRFHCNLNLLGILNNYFNSLPQGGNGLQQMEESESAGKDCPDCGWHPPSARPPEYPDGCLFCVGWFAEPETHAETRAQAAVNCWKDAPIAGPISWLPFLSIFTALM